MSSATRRNLLIAALVVVAVVIGGVIYGVSEYNRKPKDISAEKAEITTNAEEIFNAFEQNETEANEKYLNKVIAVRGTVGEITTDQSNHKVVILKTPEMMFGIACSMLPDEAAAVDRLSEGQRVTIKGLCTGYTMDVVLTNGSIVD